MHQALATDTFPVIPFGTISYTSAGAVSWTGATEGERQSGESLSFTFDGPGDVFSAVMLISPMPATYAISPFNQANPIQLCQTGQDTFVSPPISQGPGKWGFSIAFMVPGNSETRPSFYYLPDPELSVGPGTGE